MFVRGSHNAMTPFYKWRHRVRGISADEERNTRLVQTECGLLFGTHSTVSETADAGDKCDTVACNLRD